MSKQGRLRIKIQLYRGEDIALGPGKADLLEAIRAEGSISSAARALGMSYRRAWMLVEVMNRCWREPLVEASAGGRSGGGAHVTDLGLMVLALYRSVQDSSQTAAQDGWSKLRPLLNPHDSDDDGENA